MFPDFAPGNFTYDEESSSWVWTTFNSWQWDLNWRNPEVFYEFADLILWLANLGVECLRLDAIAFIHKRLGTNCQNQPEVHAITQALRAVARIGAPALIFKAEAIVGPADLAPYLGVGKHAGKLSDLAYQNSLDGADLVGAGGQGHPAVLRRAEPVPGQAADDCLGAPTCAATTTSAGRSVTRTRRRSGLNGYEHRRFLADYYAGLYPMSDARGLVFQENLATGDRRISGTAASLAGIESRCATATRPTSIWPSAGSCWPITWCWASVACRCSTWATSWPCATTTTSPTWRNMPTTTGGCTGRGCPGTWRNAGTSQTRSSIGSGTVSGTPSRSAPPSRAWTPRWRPRSSTRSTPVS